MRLIHPEVLFAAGYAIFLLLVSRVLRWRADRIFHLATRMKATTPSDNTDGLVEPSWAHGLAARFRLGLSGVLLSLAGFLLLAAGWRFHTPAEISLLAPIAAWIVMRGRELYRARSSLMLNVKSRNNQKNPAPI
jgi:hypothetical protein